MLFPFVCNADLRVRGLATESRVLVGDDAGDLRIVRPGDPVQRVEDQLYHVVYVWLERVRFGLDRLRPAHGQAVEGLDADGHRHMGTGGYDAAEGAHARLPVGVGYELLPVHVVLGVVLPGTSAPRGDSRPLEARHERDLEDDHHPIRHRGTRAP